MPEPRIDDLECAAALHWQAPETERLGDWLLRAAEGFTGRANSALPLGDPGVPLPEAIAVVEDWYRRRALPPMIVVPGVLHHAGHHRGTPPGPLENLLAERGWRPRPGPAFVMIAAIADIPARTDTEVQLDTEPDASWLALYRYRGQDLPLIARTLLMSAPWQAFATVRRDGRAVACGRISVAGAPGEQWVRSPRSRSIPAGSARVWARRSPPRWPPRRPAAARAVSCCRLRRATPRPARSTSGAGFATPIVTIT